jgi:hypothetical protein
VHPGETVFITEFFLWCGLVVAAPLLTLWVCFRTSRQRAVAVTALCLWCILAGGTLKGALWGWMASENQQFQLRKIARLPAGAKPTDVNLEPMKAIIFFVELDRLGRRLCYLPVLLPLMLTTVIVRKALSASQSMPQSSVNRADLDELSV